MKSFKILAGGGLAVHILSLVNSSISIQGKPGDVTSVETACNVFGIVNQEDVGRSTL